MSFDPLASFNLNLEGAAPIPEAAFAEINRLLLSGELHRYSGGQAGPVAALEAEFAAIMGQRFAVAVSSCAGALFLALKALNLPRGARVLVPAFCPSAVPSAVILAECRPVFCELGDGLRLDLADYEMKLPEVQAVVLRHMRGHLSDMDVIAQLARAQGVPVIEDASEALGARWRGRLAGTMGQIGCFSFQSPRMVHAGEGGMILTDDPDLAARAVIMSGAFEHHWKRHPGLETSFPIWQNRLPLYDLRMSSLAAAVIRAQLPLIAERASRGVANLLRLETMFRRSGWVDLPATLAAEQRAPDSVQFRLTGYWSPAEMRRFQQAAQRRGLPLRTIGLSPDHAEVFWNWKFLGDPVDQPRTRAYLMRLCDLRLPIWLEPAQVDQIGRLVINTVEELRPL